MSAQQEASVKLEPELQALVHQVPTTQTLVVNLSRLAPSVIQVATVLVPTLRPSLATVMQDIIVKLDLTSLSRLKSLLVITQKLVPMRKLSATLELINHSQLRDLASTAEQASTVKTTPLRVQSLTAPLVDIVQQGPNLSPSAEKVPSTTKRIKMTPQTALPVSQVNIAQPLVLVPQKETVALVTIAQLDQLRKSQLSLQLILDHVQLVIIVHKEPSIHSHAQREPIQQLLSRPLMPLALHVQLVAIAQLKVFLHLMELVKPDISVPQDQRLQDQLIHIALLESIAQPVLALLKTVQLEHTAQKTSPLLV